MTTGVPSHRLGEEGYEPPCCEELYRSPLLASLPDIRRNIVCCAERYPVALVPIELLHPHDEVDQARLDELLYEIVESQLVRKPIIVESETLTILDGHHRVSVLKKLGKRLVPALLISYEDPCLRVESWRSDWVVTKELVLRAGLSGRLLPYKTSRHILCFEIPAVNVPLSYLG
ncbi:ParB N-terminal domain-containing protein [Infirmifilum sp.]|uniref:ParB N-terminal domain-containing protein n=1 Tax=Infirmifilum sp. TaxID=2856575 RepID=UPI003D109CB2